MNIYYWSPFLSNVATVKAVLNSAISLKKYSTHLNPCIINAVGEWDSHEYDIKRNKIAIISFNKKNNFYNWLPRYGFIKSRFSYLLICLFSIIKLFKFFSSKKETDFIIIHLITALPLLLITIFNFKCKFVLRVSGYPKLNFFRKYLWKISGKKLFKVLTPTKDTKIMLESEKIFKKEIICHLRDPIINISEINIKIREKLNDNFKNDKYLLSVGRLTQQKNHEFLIEVFKIIKKKYKYLKLIILGDGELKNKLTNKIKNLNLNNDIKLLGYKSNVFNYYSKSICFILTSDWEDPGFVLIEAAAAKTPIISSNCKNGPKEFILLNERGYLYKNNDKQSFIETFDEFMHDIHYKKEKIDLKILNAFKEAKKYSKFNHFKKLIQIFQIDE